MLDAAERRVEEKLKRLDAEVERHVEAKPELDAVEQHVEAKPERDASERHAEERLKFLDAVERRVEEKLKLLDSEVERRVEEKLKLLDAAERRVEEKPALDATERYVEEKPKPKLDAVGWRVEDMLGVAMPSAVASSASVVTVAAPSSAGVSMGAGGMVVPVESLTSGIFNALGDAVGSVVHKNRVVPTKKQENKRGLEPRGMPMAAPVVERIVGRTSAVAQKKNSRSTLTHSPHEYSARMGGRVVGGVRGVFSGAGSILIGGKDLVFGVVGCVTGTVGCLTEAVFCVGDTVLGERDSVAVRERQAGIQKALEFSWQSQEEKA